MKLLIFIATQWFCSFMLLCIGEVPGPLLFGGAIDHSCLLWEKKCDGSTGACLYYDTHHMGWLLFAVCVVCKVFNVVFGLIAWRLHVRQERKGEWAENGVGLEKPADASVQVVNGGQVLATSNPAYDADSTE